MLLYYYKGWKKIEPNLEMEAFYLQLLRTVLTSNACGRAILENSCLEPNHL